MPLNPFQLEIEKLAKSMGLKGAQQQQVYNTPQFQDLVNRFYGAIPLPAGINESMVTGRTPGQVSFSDPEGFIHNLTRNLSGTDPRLGQVSESSTNRPAVLPSSKGEQSAINTLLPNLVNLFNNPLALAQIDPQTLGLLQQMKAAEDQALQEQFDREIGTVIAQLTGQGIGSSSIAGDILGQAKQQQGLVRSQAQGQQAQRQLGVQEFLTQGQQAQDQGMKDFVLNLLNQSLNRDVSGAQVGVQQQQVTNQNDQFYKTLQEQMRQFDEMKRMQERQALFSNIMKGITTGASFATGLASGGFSSLFSGAGGATSSLPTIGYGG
jgi:hypothetical protein